MEKVSENFPFKVDFSKIQADPEPYVDSIFSNLESDFLIMPKGKGFIEFAIFEQGYEALKKASDNFSRFSSTGIAAAITKTPVAFIVLRSILGINPSELAYITTKHSNIPISQTAARNLDRVIRLNPLVPLKISDLIGRRLNAHVIIEAKITEDDGTARDKATRIQHLGELSLKDMPADQTKFEVVACIGGRGFGVRREDMKKILFATRGKVFTMQTLPYMVDNTRLREFKTQ